MPQLLINAKRQKERPKQMEEKHGVQLPKLMRLLLNILFLLVSMLQIGKDIQKVSSVNALTHQQIMLS